MTNGLEFQLDLSEHEKQHDKLSNNEENLLDLSLSSSSGLDPHENEDAEDGDDENEYENETKNNPLSPEVHGQIDEVLHINENKEDNLAQFIKRAQQQGFNCLDLSKKNIHEFPATLLEFPSLQVSSYTVIRLHQ